MPYQLASLRRCEVASRLLALVSVSQKDLFGLCVEELVLDLLEDE